MNFPKLQKNVELKNYCSFQIGGPADYFYEADATEEVPMLVKAAEGIPFLIIGSGTNVLFSERGFRGLVVHFKAKKITETGGTVTADAGALLAQAAKKANIAALAGIPGTIGGAVWGNAGAKDGEIKDFIEEVEVYDPHTNETKSLKPEFKYRKSDIRDKIILRATLKKQPASDVEKIHKKLKWRATAQPAKPSAGSFFKNPNPDLPAGYLIEKAGLKGLQVGKARISEKHANFIVNLGNATQADVVELAKIAKEKVKDKFGIELEPEVRLIGENGQKLKI